MENQNSFIQSNSLTLKGRNDIPGNKGVFERLSSWCALPSYCKPRLRPICDNKQVKQYYRRQTISSPYKITHDVHIRYNYANARFEGHGAKWDVINKQFGVAYNQVPRIKVNGYDDRIPAVLVMLRKRFFSGQGQTIPHIFRESPKKSDRDTAMKEINLGLFESCNDIRIIADLIKVWFRELPIPLLHQLTPEMMSRIVKMDDFEIKKFLDSKMGTFEKSILYWLADFLIEVADYETVNHMGLTQLSIVVAPNLFRIETKNPMVAVTSSRVGVEFFYCILQYRFRRRLDQNSTNSSDYRHE